MAHRALKSLGLALIAVTIALVPSAASALLLGDQVTVSLTTLPLPGSSILGGSATVAAGPEFSVSFFTSASAETLWTLDITDTGFILRAQCDSFGLNCTYDDGLRLTLSDMNFTPPAALTGLTGIVENGLNASGAPIITPSSVVIEFAGFQIGTVAGGPLDEVSFEASFQVQQLAAVPYPGTLLLTALAAVGAGIVALRRSRD